VEEPIPPTDPLLRLDNVVLLPHIGSAALEIRRVQAVVAVAPFSTMRDAVPHFGRTMVPLVGKAIPEETYQRAIDQAGQQAGFDPDQADAVAAIRRTRAAVLIVHGTDDRIVPHWHGVRLHEAAREHSELVSVAGLGHTGIWLDPNSEVVQRAKAWFDRWLTQAGG
jgi:pimeloyl-ACP methyl ester carboxylesterase